MHKEQGFTRDISSHGVYIFAEWRPPTDVDIHVDILLPSLLGYLGTLSMSGEAKVVRVEPTATDEQSGGFVAAGESYILHRAENPEE